MPRASLVAMGSVLTLRLAAGMLLGGAAVASAQVPLIAPSPVPSALTVQVAPAGATVPLMIPYTLGAITHHYLPDFIVFDDAGVLWIVEGKAESELTNPVVVAKRDAAREWVNTVNAANEVQDRWGYVLAGEKVTAAASTWAELRAASQTHGPA